MVDVSSELREEHPLLLLRAAETHRDLGIYHGEVLAVYCYQCGNSDEDAFEIIHDEDCRLAGETQPTAYADRAEGPLGETQASDGGCGHPACPDGGQTED